MRTSHEPRAPRVPGPSGGLPVVVLAVVLGLATACGGGGTSGEGGGGDDPPVTASAEPDDTVDSGEAGDAADAGDSGEAFDGEPWGTVVVDGVGQDLALDSEMGMSNCAITDSMVAVAMMVTPDGGELFIAGGDVWGASFEMPGNLWEAASDDPEIPSDVTREISPNHAVLDGTWVSSTTGDTAEIRIELFCPSA